MKTVLPKNEEIVIYFKSRFLLFQWVICVTKYFAVYCLKTQTKNFPVNSDTIQLRYCSKLKQDDECTSISAIISQEDVLVIQQLYYTRFVNNNKTIQH